MKQKLVTELAKFGYPVFLQGSMNADDPYPETFITFFSNDTPPISHYDNEAVSYAWDFSVMFYSSDPVLVNSKPEEIRAALKKAGFVSQGKGQDIASDEQSHTGWAMEFSYIERIKNNGGQG